MTKRREAYAPGFGSFSGWHRGSAVGCYLINNTVQYNTTSGLEPASGTSPAGRSFTHEGWMVLFPNLLLGSNDRALLFLRSRPDGGRLAFVVL